MARPSRQSKINKKISEAKTKFGPELVERLKDAAKIGAPPVEQYYYAGISKSTYFRWLQEHPDLKEDLETLENGALKLKARTNMAEYIKNKDINISMEYLKRTDDKMRTQKIESNVEVSNKNENDTIHPEDEALNAEYKQKLLENIKQRAIEKSKQNNQ